MSNVFGNKKTNTKLSLNTTLKSLSDKAMSTLVFVLDKLEENSLLSEEKRSDERGVYIDHDSSECKPFNTKSVKELVNSGLVQEHPESGQGVSFLTANNDVMYAAAEIGEFDMIYVLKL